VALVCLCNGVNERKVARAVERGADTIEAVGRACGAGTTCHGCHATIEELIEARLAVAPIRLAVS
jgi:assimilatory nitrate reductase catalytic subunit